MEIGKQSLPEWLEPWLQLPFYEEKCKKHGKKYTTVYCGVCKEDPVCEVCWEKNNSKQHCGHHHQILQVCTASRRAAIYEVEISKLLDISDIQKYVINGKHIVFLNPHKEGAPNPHRSPNCEICRRRLIDFKYRFCSIACKSRSMECGYIQIEKKTDAEKQQQQQQPPTLQRKRIGALRKRRVECDMQIGKKTYGEQQQPVLKRKMNTECSFTLRKRSRKGIPQRAPLK